MSPFPGYFWSKNAPRTLHLDSFVELVAEYGYQCCTNGTIEGDVQKIVLYGTKTLVTHAARQLPNGRWTSKLGGGEDIEHDTPEAVTGEAYGPVLAFFQRPIENAESTINLAISWREVLDSISLATHRSP